MSNVPTIYRSFDCIEEAILSLQKQITSLRVSLDGTSSSPSVPTARNQKERPSALLADINWRQDRIGSMLAEVRVSLANVQNIVSPPASEPAQTFRMEDHKPGGVRYIEENIGNALKQEFNTTEGLS